MKLVVKYFDKDVGQIEIPLTTDEAEQIKQALLNNAEWITIGNEAVQTRYIIGIFEGEEPTIGEDRQIEAPYKEKDLTSIRKILDKMRQELEKKGVFNKRTKLG